MLVNLLRGSKKAESIIDIQRCSGLDWGIFAIYVLISIAITVWAVFYNKRCQALKEMSGTGLVSSDIRFQGKQLFFLLFFAFIGGWVSGALGLGGGSIYNPLLISMGVPPTVSTSTGMYMIMLSSTVSSCLYIMFGRLDISFGLWLGFWTTIGIVFGLKVIKGLMKKYERQSIIVFVLVGVLLASAILVPIFSTMQFV